MNESKIIHFASIVIGSSLLVFSIVSALLFSYPHFYTWFALGTWLVFDWLDYQKNGKSILGYFYNSKNRLTFLIFFISATIAAFTIDYVYGVRLSKMWEWPAYSRIHFIRMYSIMNVAYIFSMYELYRVFHSYLKPYISEHHKFIFMIRNKLFINIIGILAGIIFLISPLLFISYGVHVLKYIMLLPFIGMWLISDTITSIFNGKTIIGEIIRGNMLQIISLTLTGLFATLMTEIINLYAHEWNYLYMPFENLKLYKIPLAVIIGWIPLVVGVIALLNMVKHVSYVSAHKSN